MRSYNQFCPVAKAAELFCERWTALIVRDLAGGERRFSDLQRGVPLVSPTMLSQRLKQLETEGVVSRRRSSGRGSIYRLTKAGEEFVPIVLALGTWGQRWTRRALAEHEIDLGLLLWALEQGAHPECFGRERTIIEIDLTDQPQQKRRWWFLNEDGRCELCLKPPGREAQLYDTVSLRDLVHVWRGDLSLSAAMASGRLQVDGISRLRRGFRQWLAISVLAHVKPARRDMSGSAERAAA